MKLTKKQLRKIINEEAGLLNKPTQNTVGYTGNSMAQETLKENWATSGMKAAATDIIPGGRFVSDYAQAQEFDSIDDRLDALEGDGSSGGDSIGDRILSLERRFKDIEDSLDAWLGKYN